LAQQNCALSLVHSSSRSSAFRAIEGTSTNSREFPALGLIFQKLSQDIKPMRGASVLLLRSNSTHLQTHPPIEKSAKGHNLGFQPQIMAPAWSELASGVVPKSACPCWFSRSFLGSLGFFHPHLPKRNEAFTAFSAIVYTSTTVVASDRVSMRTIPLLILKKRGQKPTMAPLEK